MTGIVSTGAYLPIYRLTGEEIGRMWRTKGTAGRKAVAGYDEDALTMAVAAVQDCLKGADRNRIGALYLASTTMPYREKQNAAIVASALDMDRACFTADQANSLRSGTIGLRLALDAVRSGSAKEAMVVASDCRMGAPGGRFEQTFGDGAAAVTVGRKDVIAEVEDSLCIFDDFTDEWRMSNDLFVRSGETRFIEEAGYLPAMRKAIPALVERNKLALSDISRFVLSAFDDRVHSQLVKGLGLHKDRVQDPLFAHIGNTGTPAVLIMFIAALEGAKPGERILLANYGDGVDCVLFRATDAITTLSERPTISERSAADRPIDYGSYLNWRGLVPFETSSLPDRADPSLATRWRERRTVSALYGFRCRRCGTPQMHPSGQAVRICVACQAKDEFEPYCFADKRGTLFTYAVDQLQPTKNPPGLNGVVDFDGGGRLICELTDYDLEKVAIGTAVEMTFRKLAEGKGIVNYFWKAKPA
jgi:3-hydroxy-3-methylglutaryl CoA synthase